jgi:hypothetical protein
MHSFCLCLPAAEQNVNVVAIMGPIPMLASSPARAMERYGSLDTPTLHHPCPNAVTNASAYRGCCNAGSPWNRCSLIGIAGKLQLQELELISASRSSLS